MDNEAMGLDLFIEREKDAESGRYRHVTLGDAKDNATRIRLVEALVEAMVRQKVVVCRGTTCFRTGSNHVAKFSWASEKRKLAEMKGGKGFARVVAHRQITIVAQLRVVSRLSRATHFRNEEASFEDPQPVAKSTNRLSYKRKSSSGHTPDTSGSRRQQSNSQNPKLTQKLNKRQGQT